MSHVIGLLGCFALICASVDAAVQRKPRALVEAERARSAEALRGQAKPGAEFWHS
jgi:hypothetical protein